MSITEPSLENKKAYFMLPGFWEHFETYKGICAVLEKVPWMKRENAEIYCFYGNFPFCSWDGGRVFNKYSPATIEQMQEIKEFYNNKLNKPIRFVFTNCLLEKKNCFERYNNIALKMFDNGQNEIVLASDVLEDYIRSEYPSYSLISSTTKCLSRQEDSKKELNKEQYKFICLDYNLNHNLNYLNSLNPEEKEKVEFLVNPICGPGCPVRKEHYRLNSLHALSYGKQYQMKDCYISGESLTFCGNKNAISSEEIYNKYLEEGFKYFKLEGRTFSGEVIAQFFSEYLIKPEYKIAFLRLLK